MRQLARRGVSLARDFWCRSGAFAAIFGRAPDSVRGEGAAPAHYLVAVIILAAVIQGCAQKPVRDSREESTDPEKAAEIYTELGLGYLQQGRYELAQNKLGRALELHGGNADTHHYIAEVYKQLGEFDLADKHYRRAVALTPNDHRLLNNYGAYLCDRTRFEKAEEYFLRAAALPRNKTPEFAYENIALCALRVDNMDKAESYFRKALELRPQLPKSLLRMAELTLNQGEYLSARAFLQRFHGVVTETRQSLRLGIRIETALGDAAAIEKFSQLLAEKFPESVD